MTSTWKIYWWAKTDQPKKYGNDIVTIEADELDEEEADHMLENASLGKRTSGEKYTLPNFQNYYLNANLCQNFGAVKVRQIKK